MAEGVNVATLVAQLKLDLGNFQQGVKDLDTSLNKVRKGLEDGGKATDIFGGAVGKAQEGVSALGIQSVTLTRGLALLANPLTIVGAGIAAVAATAYFATEAMKENARSVQSLMAVSGLSADAADNLADTFGVLGFESEHVANAMFRMGAEIESGGAGLGRLGVSLRNTSGELKTEGVLFLEVRDRISELGSATERTAALQDIFGRGARALAPAFALNREEFQRWMTVASGLSPWSDEAQQKTIELIRAQNQLSAAWSGLKEALGAVLVGPATETVSWLSTMAVKLRELVEWAEKLPPSLRQLPGPLGALIETMRAAPPLRGGLPEEDPGALARGTAGTGTPVTRRTTAEFAQEGAAIRLALAQRMAYFDRVAALRSESVAQEQTDQQTLLRGALADFGAREQATRQYFTAQRAIIIEQMGSTEAAAKTKLAELDAAQVTAVSQIGTARIQARAQLAAIEIQEQKTLREQWIAGQVAMADEVIANTDKMQDNVVKFADSLTPLWEQMRQDGISAWMGIVEAQEQATDQMEQGLSGARDQLRAFFQEGRDLQQFGLQGIAGRGTALRGAGVAFDTSGAQQSAVENRIGALTQQLAQWESVIGNVDKGTDRFNELQGSINAATGELTQLTTALGGLQQLNSLKGLVSDVFGSLNRAISTSITGVMQGTTTIKQAFDNMAQSIVLSITETIIKRGFMAMENAFFKMLDEMSNKAQESGIWTAIIRAIGGAAIGAAGGVGGAPDTSAGSPGAEVSGGELALQGGGIVTKPTRALVGERAAEAVIPLSELGRYTATAGGGGGTGPMVQVIITNTSSAEIEHKETSSSDGRRKLELLIRDSQRKNIADGSMDKVLGSSFGLSRQGVPR